MTLAPADPQLTLLETTPSWRITKNAQARNAYGTVAQELVCATLRLTPIRINGNYDVCFDALGRDGTYYEIKSVHARGGKVVCYDWRMEKEASVTVPVNYAVLLHNVKRSDGRKLVGEFIEGGLELLVLPARLVHGVARGESLRKLMTLPLDECAGYNRTGYRDGYRNVPVTKLRELCRFNTVVQATYAGHSLTVEIWSDK